MRRGLTSLAVLAALAATLAHAQGLGDAAAREKKRREEIQKKQGGASTTISGDDLAWTTWKIFRSAKRGFSVSFPVKPVITDEDVGDGGAPLIRTLYVATQDKRIYSVAVTDYPPEALKDGVDLIFSRAEQRAAEDWEATPRERAPAFFQGFPSQSFELQSQMTDPELAFLSFQGRMVLAGTRLYVVVQVLLNGADTADMPGEFWESFEITRDAKSDTQPAK